MNYFLTISIPNSNFALKLDNNKIICTQQILNAVYFVMKSNITEYFQAAFRIISIYKKVNGVQDNDSTLINFFNCIELYLNSIGIGITTSHNEAIVQNASFGPGLKFDDNLAKQTFINHWFLANTSRIKFDGHNIEFTELFMCDAIELAESQTKNKQYNNDDEFIYRKVVPITEEYKEQVIEECRRLLIEHVKKIEEELA